VTTDDGPRTGPLPRLRG